MESVCLFLLASLLCFKQAQSLQCYTCADFRDTSKCPSITCPAEHKVCFKGEVTTTLADGTGNKIRSQYRSCAPSCEAISKVIEGLQEATAIQTKAEGLTTLNLPKMDIKVLTCCDKNLCNGAGQTNHSPVALAGGILLSLGSTLLWALL
ncbi:lymphocyte antigen 6H-like [Carlito syrichta]|uniref:Lymphocyte antigen 6H-like n=1 Tax=Carlito syrichta TaxID=1868482 RepID=A0A1U7UTF9_CARSF|nr:lymphocyte antigen 6H-like [Carlito syrichta]